MKRFIRSILLIITEIGAIKSPFYPISHPNQKTPSPYNDEKSKSTRDVTGVGEFRGIVQDQDTRYYLTETTVSTQAFDISQYQNSKENISIKVSSENDSDCFISSSLTKNYSYGLENDAKVDEKISEKDVGRTSGKLKG